LQRPDAGLSRTAGGLHIVDADDLLARGLGFVGDAEGTATVLRRWSEFIPLSGRVRLSRRSAFGSLRSSSLLESSFATSADWLNPRCHKRVRFSGTGTGMVAPPDCSISDATYRVMVCATATIRPNLSGIAKLRAMSP